MVTDYLINFLSSGNSLLLNSSMQPDLTVSRTYSGPICLQDPLDKELMTESSLFNPLSDIKVKVQSSFMVSLGVTERSEYHGKTHSGTFPHDNNRIFNTIHAKPKPAYIQNLSSLSKRSEMRATGVFGHLGGRLGIPNSGELWQNLKMFGNALVTAARFSAFLWNCDVIGSCSLLGDCHTYKVCKRITD